MLANARQWHTHASLENPLPTVFPANLRRKCDVGLTHYYTGEAPHHAPVGFSQS